MVKTVYETEDGKIFEDKQEAFDHEVNQKIQSGNEEGLEKYLKTYSGARLLEKYKLEEEGVWRVSGEDPNCDMVGLHHNPYLGTVSGTLRKAIIWGVNQPKFWQWGAGGKFSKVDIEDL